MRSENSVKNSFYAIVGQVVSLVFGFITRIAFVRILGEVYLGVNGVFYSILSLLSLSELGMGAAFTYSLYKPIATRDRAAICRIMNLYALAYKIVAAAVSVLGLCLMPFLPLIIGDVEVSGIGFIYVLFLANSAASYLFSYKRSLITASQQDFRNSINISFFSVIQNVLQLIFLLITKSYILYLIIQLAVTVISNLSISKVAKVLFPYLGKSNTMPTETEKNEIKRNVKDMFLTRFGSVTVTGTDNLLISTIDVVLVGLYSNYLQLILTVQAILTQIMNGVTASVGNLIAEGGGKRSEVYRNILFAVAWLYGFSAIALDALMGRFVTIAFGPGLEVPIAAVHAMSLNVLLGGLRQPNMMYINAGGLFSKVKWRGFVEAAVNLVISIIFLKMDMGLFGVLLGTTVSHIFVGIPWEANCVMKASLRGKWFFYYDSIIYLGVIGVTWVINGFICSLIPGGFIGFIVAGIITLIIPNGVFLLLSRGTPQFRFFYGVLMRFVGKIIGKRA